MTWVKICGTTSLGDARVAVDAGADALGFIFAESPRRIAPEQAREIIRELPDEVTKIGVFVNETAARMWEIIRSAGLTGAQLQGEETPEVARELKQMVDGRVRIFKALGVSHELETSLCEFADSTAVDGILLDSFAARSARQAESEHKVARGGTGKTFDWKSAESFVAALAQRRRVIIAGGLSPENVAQAIRTFSPWGVDVCSGVEAMPGRKDAAKIQRFIAAARSAVGGV